MEKWILSISWKKGTDDVQKVVTELVTDKYEISPKWKEKYKIEVPLEEDILSSKIYTDMLRLKLVGIRKFIQNNLHELQSASSDEDHHKFQKIHMSLKKSENEIAEALGIIVSR